MPEVNLPLSGPVVQTFNIAWPVPFSFGPWPYPPGPPTVSVGTSARPEVEREVLAEAGSYGRQLGRIGDALLVLLKDVDLEKLSEAEAKAIRELKVMLETIADIKERHGAKHVLKPSWP
jgi:hypothetical protein